MKRTLQDPRIILVIAILIITAVSLGIIYGRGEDGTYTYVYEAPSSTPTVSTVSQPDEENPDEPIVISLPALIAAVQGERHQFDRYPVYTFFEIRDVIYQGNWRWDSQGDTQFYFASADNVYYVLAEPSMHEDWLSYPNLLETGERVTLRGWYEGWGHGGWGGMEKGTFYVEFVDAEIVR